MVFTFEIISPSFVIGVIPFLKSLRDSTKDSFFLDANSKAKGDGGLGTKVLIMTQLEND